MSSSKAVARVAQSAIIEHDPSYRVPQTAEEVLRQISIVDEIKTKVMREGMHYGTIPGGSKPALFKPGAEKLCLTFKLSHEFDVEVEKFPNGHRHYTVNCRLRYRDGTLVGQGVGICSTMESKYRFRTDFGGPVPAAYWDNRDPELLGGRQFSPRKIKGKWVIVQKVEHDNPADYYNTAIKMAKKRAHVDATLSATAASDIFDQDTEDRDDDHDAPDDLGGDDTGSASSNEPRSRGGDGKSTPAQHTLIRGKLGAAKLNEADLLAHFKVAKLEDLPFDQVNAAFELIKGRAANG
jgi:hypothetical protein